MSDSRKQVLLVEDEPRTAALIRDLLVATRSLDVRIASTRQQGEREGMAPELNAAIVDLGLPDGDGVDLIATLHAHRAQRPILALTSAAGADRILASLRAGAAGYLLKDDMDARLAAAVSELCSGGSPLSDIVSSILVRHVRADTIDAHPLKLTRCELAVLELIAIGAGYKEIATETETSINTVRSHVRAIYKKLGVENRAEATNLAWRVGLLRKGLTS